MCVTPCHDARMETKFDRFRPIALNAGVKKGTLRQWRKRMSIPSTWKLKIFEHTYGAISLQHMADLFDDDPRFERGDAE